ncbi:MAG: sodium:calcium antiporter [Actinomycetia bacterium]|nr:sodium:calcium antiporter [Actinomycetes bacterium]
MGIDIIRVIAGLVILIVAADRLVVSAVRVSKVLNVSTVVIGAVVVGFGTSVPEFVVSAVASSTGQLDLALSNVVASNTSNLTLVLGLAAIMTVVSTTHTVIKREGLLMMAAVAALAIVLIPMSVTRVEGVALLLGMIVAIFLLIRWARVGVSDSSDDAYDIEADSERVWLEVIYGVAALTATVIAGYQLLLGVVGIGDHLGLSVVFMGLITGVGTSLPELSAAIAAARRKQSDLVLGNVLGSNVFNSLGVAGLAIVIGPGALELFNPWLVGLMVGSAIFAGFFAFTGQRIARWEGFVLLSLFGIYSAASI